MERHALHLARTAAERTGVSLSSLVNAALERHLEEVLAALERRRAAEEVIATFPQEYLPTIKEQQSLLALWNRGGNVPTDAEIDAAFAPAPKGRHTRRRRTSTRVK
jgi:hypothetical protein